MVSSLARIDWHRFLGRPRLPLVPPRILDGFGGERILVTGAGGTIGAALALRLAPSAPRSLVLLDVSARRLAALKRIFASRHPASRATFVRGSVADSDLVETIFKIHAPTKVFHAAAAKHVAPLEAQAFAAVENNVFGTATLIACASARGGAGILLISTDKAVNPRSVMGATKRVAEELVRSAGGSALRLGNVLASRDSVAEIFARQLESGRALTVTSPAARRYFLTVEEAVDLLLTASETAERSSLFVPNLDRQYFITDLAGFMARELAPGRNCGIDFSRLGPGDKECEELWSADEHAGRADQNGLVPILSPAWSRARAAAALAVLGLAWGAPDLGALVAALEELVPGYTPSRTVIGLAQESSPRCAS